MRGASSIQENGIDTRRLENYRKLMRENALATATTLFGAASRSLQCHACWQRYEIISPL